MKIAIAGYGIEGKSSYNYWNRPDNQLVILDERENPGAFDDLSGYDMVIRSPGIAPKKLSSAPKIWSATNQFFAQCPAPIIGVTGTKGKGTTCSLITSILRAAGKTVHLVGNIGTPALDTLAKIQPDDIVVFELSSFQLWDLEKSPHVAVVLMIEADHLDVHDDFDDYINAKAKIVLEQTPNDIIIFNQNNQYSCRIAERSLGQKINYPFAIEEFLESLKLPGRHNQENASAAIAAARVFAVDDEAIKHGLAAFDGLPHRLKFVREVSGVKFYDDSIATTPGSAIAALESFDEPKILLLGGREKGARYNELLQKCADKGVRVIAYGENRDTLKQLCDEIGVKCQVSAGVMKNVVASALENSSEGDVVILSPAAASFDMFKNYADRGDQFTEAVNQL